MTQRQSFDSFSNSNHGIPSNMFSWSTLQLWIGIIISQISHNFIKSVVVAEIKRSICLNKKVQSYKREVIIAHYFKVQIILFKIYFQFLQFLCMELQLQLKL